MDQTNTSLSKHAHHYLRKTVIVVVTLLIVMSAIRAGVVLFAIRKAADGQPYNVELTARWSPAYPALYDTLIEIAPDTPITYHNPNRLLLSWPDRLINLCLQYTRAFWQPQMPDTSTTLPQNATPRTTTAPPAPTPPAMPIEGTNTPTAAAPTVAAHERTTTPPPQPEPPPTHYDPNALWAAVIAPEAPVYDTNGQRSETVPAGSVVHITGQRATTNNRTLYTGTVHSPVGRFEGVLLREQDLQLYRGKTLLDTSRDERERASNRARLQGAIIARIQQLETAHANRNPHQKRYHEMLRRYQQLRNEAQPLQAKYENRTGAERIAAGNQLREIQQEMATLTPAIRELQQKRDAWNAANPQTQPPDPEQDPQIINLRRQLNAITP